MGHERSEHKQSLGPPAVTVARALAILLVVCLVECASEQRNSNRGSKTPNFVEKPNGWRSQRGGSCLSYGHSCWGAHGKRSGQNPMSLPRESDWYLMRLLRKISALESPQAKQPQHDNRDFSDIFRAEDNNEETSNNALENMETEEASVLSLGLRPRRRPDAIPMLDNDNLANYKLIQLMKGSSGEK